MSIQDVLAQAPAKVQGTTRVAARRNPMSLDVYLEGSTSQVPCTCSHCWNEHTREKTERYFDANITHNLGKMASEAGIYDAVWRPEENGITKGRQLIEPLEAGIALLRSDPERFKQFNASNGWGLYENFVPWLEKYLLACKEYPDANVRVSR